MKHNIIKSNLLIREAIKILEGNKENTLFVEKKKKIIGIFTIGDFRNAVLKGLDINKPIKFIMNKSFKYLKTNYKNYEIKKIFNLNPLIEDVPILNKKKILIDVVSRLNFYKQKNNIMKEIDVVIMAGGQGKRMDPFTRVLPKPLLPIDRDTILKKIVDKFFDYGFRKFFITINEKKSLVTSYINEYLRDRKIKTIDEKIPLGTIGSLKLLEKKISKLFIVTNCDILINIQIKELINQHIKSKNDLTIISSYKNFEIPYGVFSATKNGNLKNFYEKPSTNHLVNCGVYLMNKSVLKFIPSNKNFDADQLIKILVKNKKKIKVFPISESSWKDFGIWKEYFKNINS